MNEKIHLNILKMISAFKNSLINILSRKDGLPNEMKNCIRKAINRQNQQDKIEATTADDIKGPEMRKQAAKCVYTGPS